MKNQWPTSLELYDIEVCYINEMLAFHSLLVSTSKCCVFWRGIEADTPLS